MILYLPNELIVYICTYLYDWCYSIVFVNKKLKACMIHAIRSNFSYKSRRYIIAKTARESVQNYPNLVKWLHENNLIINYDKYCRLALEFNQREIVDLAITNLDDNINEYLLKTIIVHGTIDELRKAFLNYQGDTKDLCKTAAKWGKKYQIEFLVNQGCYYDITICKYIAKSQNIDLLKWWIENEFPVYKYIYEAARTLSIVDRKCKWSPYKAGDLSASRRKKRRFSGK